MNTTKSGTPSGTTIPKSGTPSGTTIPKSGTPSGIDNLINKNNDNFLNLINATEEFVNDQIDNNKFDPNKTLVLPKLDDSIYKNMDSNIHNETVKSLILGNQKIPEINIQTVKSTIKDLDTTEKLKNDNIANFSNTIFENLKKNQQLLEKEIPKGSNITGTENNISKRFQALVTKSNSTFFSKDDVLQITFAINKFMYNGMLVPQMIANVTQILNTNGMTKDELLKNYNGFREKDKSKIEKVYDYIMSKEYADVLTTTNARSPVSLFFALIISLNETVEYTLEAYCAEKGKSEEYNKLISAMTKDSNIESNSSNNAKPRTKEEIIDEIKELVKNKETNLFENESSVDTNIDKAIALIKDPQDSNKILDLTKDKFQIRINLTNSSIMSFKNGNMDEKIYNLLVEYNKISNSPNTSNNSSKTSNSLEPIIDWLNESSNWDILKMYIYAMYPNDFSYTELNSDNPFNESSIEIIENIANELNKNKYQEKVTNGFNEIQIQVDLAMQYKVMKTAFDSIQKIPEFNSTDNSIVDKNFKDHLKEIQLFLNYIFLFLVVNNSITLQANTDSSGNNDGKHYSVSSGTKLSALSNTGNFTIEYQPSSKTFYFINKNNGSVNDISKQITNLASSDPKYSGLSIIKPTELWLQADNSSMRDNNSKIDINKVLSQNMLESKQ